LVRFFICKVCMHAWESKNWPNWYACMSEQSDSHIAANQSQFLTLPYFSLNRTHIIHGLSFSGASVVRGRSARRGIVGLALVRASPAVGVPRSKIRMEIGPNWIYFWHGEQQFSSCPGEFARAKARNLHWHAGQSTKTRSWGRDWTVFVRPNEKKWSWDLPGEMAGDALNILIFIVGWMYSTRSMLSIWDYENWPFDAWFTLDTCIYFQMKGWKPKINISEWLESTSIIMGIW
jgi:hypothetical protein